MPFAERPRFRILYEIHGDPASPPLLLVMGLGFSSGAWAGLPKRLAEQFRVITFDNRGTGKSECPRGPFRTRDLADDAAAVLDAAGIESAYVFGISMGGMIASELVLRHPKRVKSLVLAATFAGYLRSTKPSLGSIVDLLVAALLPRPTGLSRLARLLVSDAYFDANPAAFADWIRGTGATSPRTAIRQMLAVGLHGTEKRLESVNVPTLVLTGNADRLVPSKNSERLARLIPNAKLVELEGAGHCFAVEREDETVDVIVSHFLAVR